MNFSLLKKAAFIALAGAATFAYAQDEKKEDLSADKKTMSYAHGHGIGKQVLEQIEFYNKEEFIKGLKEALEGKDSSVSDADAEKAYRKLEPLMREAYQKRIAAKKEAEKKKNIESINAFLKEDLKKTATGLAYKVIKAGEGDMPKATDTVTVHYTGYLTDGSKFDSSVDRGQPASFPLNGVIKGWTEGLQLMKIGAKYRFKIPPELGYGASGAGGSIPPNATLIFDVELIAIRKDK